MDQVNFYLMLAATGLEAAFNDYDRRRPSGLLFYDPVAFYIIDNFKVSIAKLITDLIKEFPEVFRYLKMMPDASSTGYLNRFAIELSKYPIEASMITNKVGLLLAQDIVNASVEVLETLKRITKENRQICSEEALAMAWDMLPSVSDEPKQQYTVVFPNNGKLSTGEYLPDYKAGHFEFLFRKNYVGRVCVGWQHP